MTCRELVELVTEYMEGTLREEDRLRLDVHLAECPYCEEYLAQMRRTVEMLGRVPSELIDPSKQEELLEAFRGWRGA
jgi:anti-sigma factor RsiW